MSRQLSTRRLKPATSLGQEVDNTQHPQVIRTWKVGVFGSPVGLLGLVNVESLE